VVHSQGKDNEFDKLVVFKCVPFNYIPIELIEQIKERGFNYEKFLRCCTVWDRSGVFWNILIIKDGQAVAVVWGTWDMLESHLRVIRISVLPKVRSKRFLVYLLNKIREFCNEIQASKCYWESHQWKAWVRLLDGFVKHTNATLVEVY
jgi:hypothetical protein